MNGMSSPTFTPAMARRIELRPLDKLRPYDRKCPDTFA
jgi:hypothetical protein